MIWFNSDSKKKKATKTKTINNLKQYTITFKVNIATYDVEKINRHQLLEWLESQLNYGNWDMIWDKPVLQITGRKR